MPASPVLDAFDRAILDVVQADAQAELQAIAERARLSPSACWRRIRKLEAAGVIVRRVTLLSPRALGLELAGFVTVRISDHSEAWTAAFEQKAAALPEVVELHRMTGDVDYLLKIVTRDMEAYDALYRRLIRIPGLADVSASFSMEAIKATTALPLA